MPYHLNTTRVLYQTSKYAPVAVIQLDVTIPVEAGASPGKAQINALLYQLSASAAGGPLSLPRGNSAAEIYCDLVLELQRYAGHSVEYRQVQASESGHDRRVFIEYEEQETALYAGELATELLNAGIENGQNPDAMSVDTLQQSLDEYVGFAIARRLDPNSRLLIRAANRRDIPLLRLDQPPFSPPPSQAVIQNGTLQLGWGTRQRRCRGPLPEGFTSLENLQQISDRYQLLDRLKSAAVPLADQDLEFINRNQVRRAQRSAGRVGYPVTLRPRMNATFHYRLPDNLVFGPLHDDTQVALVVNHFRENVGADTWVESYVAGGQYRFLVLNGEVLSVVCCIPPTIIGDGSHSIAELVRQQAAAAANMILHRAWRALAQDDSSMVCRLQLAGLGLDGIPESGDRIALSGFGTLYNGGTCEDVTTTMAPRFNALAVKIAELSGLEHLAGVDLIIDDPSGPAAMPNCALDSVVPDPDMQMHAQFSAEHAHHIGDKYMELLFPVGHPSRIPTVAVTGTNGKTTTSRMVTRILQTAGLKVGLACTDGVYLDNELLLAGDMAGVRGAATVLSDKQIEAAVLETARGGMATRGIAFDRCDVGACLNVAGDHLGDEGIGTLDDMAVHKRQVIERTTGTVVLNAEDPRCLAMREHTNAETVILIAQNSNHPAIETHIQSGGKAIVIDTIENKPKIVLETSDNKIVPIMSVNEIPATLNGTARHNVFNAMFSVGIGLGLGIPQKYIVSALTAFKMGVDNTPGRLNEIDGYPFKVLVDVAHNVHGIESLVEFIAQLSVRGKKIINFGVSGRQSDEDIQKFAKVTAKNFDLYILRNYHMDMDMILKNPKHEDVPEMLKTELMRNGVLEKQIIVSPNVMKSLDQGLESAKEGDLLIVLTRVAGTDKFKVVKKLKEAAAEYLIVH